MNTKTIFYIIKRILLALVTVWVVVTITFFTMHMIPGGPFLAEKAITKEAEAQLKAQYGLDKPLFEQYTTYLKEAVHGDFGPSIKRWYRTSSKTVCGPPLSWALPLLFWL